MTELVYYKKCLKFLIIGGFIGLFLTGNHQMFSISYCLMLIFMIIRTFRINTTILIKVYLIILYSLITIASIGFCTLDAFSVNQPIYILWFNRILCTAILSTPFLIEKVVTVKKYIDFRLPSLEECYVLSFAEIRESGDKILSKIATFKNARKNLSVENLEELIADLPRHSAFRYVNDGNLSDKYFEKAYDNLSDNHIYLIISDTGSPASEVISVFSQKHFNHSSIAFDKELMTIVSYNGGEKVYPPGLNLEMVELFQKKLDSVILVYSLECTTNQKKIIIDKIKEINTQGSAYNLLGLLLKQSYKPNIMFCSQFVYKMLEISDLLYFNKDSKCIKPTDFIEMDYMRKLHFEYSIMNRNKM